LQHGGLILGFVTSLAISIAAIPSIVTVARSKKLYDKPQGRKPGRKKVPTLGGLAIFAGSIIPLALFSDFSKFTEFPYLIAGSVILFFIGIKDDILIIAPWWKLSGQILAAVIISVLSGLQIVSLNTFPWLYQPGHWAGTLGTILMVVFVINSFNLIDGIDGLASGLGIFYALFMGFIFFRSQWMNEALLSVVLCGSLLGFFYFNVFSRKNKIFMGDTGSMAVGFLLSFLALRFIELEDPSLAGIKISSPHSLTLALFIVPVGDMARVLLGRIGSGRSPLRPDRSHIHYRLIDAGLTHGQATLTLLLVNAVAVILVLGWQNLGEVLLTVLVILYTIFLYLAACWLRNSKKPAS
jgi:UDP-N-acetylmuramyl pentapeptide phosphotransferase/UDP-N-acetylglucosamine-1-phosphate transferase